MTSFESDANDVDTTDALSLDTDGDGYAETTIMDLDGDAVVDAVITEDVWTGAVVALADTDGDGTFDTTVADFDGDGVVDMTAVDIEGDGIPEYVEVGQDPFAVTDDGSELETDTDDGDVEPFTVDEEVDGETVAAEDGVHGDPMAETEFHQAQPGPVDCVPTSIAMVATEIGGEEVSADEVVAKAHEMNVMTSTGMAPEDGVRLLEEFGVEAELETGTMDDLRTALDNGQEVIIGLDSADLYANGGGPFDPGMQTGHAVVITGIDDNTGTVYINDPGFPDGAGVAISIEDFEDAWADSDNTMIVATESGTETTEDEGYSGIGTILLPFKLLVDRL